MSVLADVQNASVRLLGYRVSTVYSGTDQVEFAELANEVAEDIAKAYDWQELRTLYTVSGDGTTQTFSLPSDYARMLLNGAIFSTRSRLPLSRIRDQNQWLDFLVTGIHEYPGYWIILGNTLQILPVLAAAENAKFYYVTNQWAATSTGTPKASFTLDTDEFRLPSRLLRLGLMWRWRARKGLEYAEDLENYEKALAHEIVKDRGVGTLAVGRARISDEITVAYPGVIVP